MDERDIDLALDAELEFVLTLGGFALRVPGAVLVTHEKIPVPRFNYVLVGRIGAERQTAFFEKTLDHYFQRAIRPTFRVVQPAQPHVDMGLRRLGFTPGPEPVLLLLEGSTPRPDSSEAAHVRPARDDEIDDVVAFWTGPKERPEFRTAIDIAWHHPHPGEELLPLLGTVAGKLVASSLLYRHGPAAGIHFVSTSPPARGQGVASELVRYALRHRPLNAPVRFSIFSDSPRLQRRLESLGFEIGRAFTEYILPEEAELALPPAGPSSPPQWRPPRSAKSPH